MFKSKLNIKVDKWQVSESTNCLAIADFFFSHNWDRDKLKKGSRAQNYSI